MNGDPPPLSGNEPRPGEPPCPNCGRPVGAAAKCPFCGTKLVSHPVLAAAIWGVVLLGLAGLFFHLVRRDRAGGAAGGTTVAALGDIAPEQVGSTLLVEGRVLDLFPPAAGSKRPYGLKIADDSGEQTLFFWQTTYDQIQGKEILNGARVRARVVVETYRDRLQLKLAAGRDLEILDGAPAGAAPASPAGDKTYPPRDFSRGRSVQAGSLPVGAVTVALSGRTVRVRGRVESVSPPQAGTQQPFAVVLREGDATLRAVYWPAADEVIAVKPTPGALFELEGEVEVFRDRPQLKVKSGYKVRLVDATPASAPAVDATQAVPVASITAAARGETRVVRGVLGAPRALRGGVVYALTDDSGTIDLVLWESIVPVDVLEILEEGARVAASGEVGEYEGKLQLKAAPGYSAMLAP